MNRGSVQGSIHNGTRRKGRTIGARPLATRPAAAKLAGRHVELAALHPALADARAAPAIAARWYRAALRLLPSGCEADHKRLGVRVPLAGALCSSGQLTEGRAGCRRPWSKLQSQERFGCATASCAFIEHLLGRHSEARARLLRGLSRASTWADGRRRLGSSEGGLNPPRSAWMVRLCMTPRQARSRTKSRPARGNLYLI